MRCSVLQHTQTPDPGRQCVCMCKYCVCGCEIKRIGVRIRAYEKIRSVCLSLRVYVRAHACIRRCVMMSSIRLCVCVWVFSRACTRFCAYVGEFVCVYLRGFVCVREGGGGVRVRVVREDRISDMSSHE